MRASTLIYCLLALVIFSLTPQSTESAQLLRHRFVAGELRRYRCAMQTIHESEGTCWESRLVMIEEERCHELADGVADISYLAVAMAVQDFEDGVLVYADADRRALDVDSEFQRKALAEQIGLGEGLRYLIDADMQVLAVLLPESLSLSERHRLDDSYRRALNSRYRSFFPKEAIKPGDTWVAEIPFDAGFWAKHEHVSRADYQVTARHMGREIMRGHRCIKLRLQIELATDQEVTIRRGSHDRTVIESLTAHSDVWFDLAVGAPVLERSQLEAQLRREIKTGPKDVREIAFRVRQSIETTLAEPEQDLEVAILAQPSHFVEQQEAE